MRAELERGHLARVCKPGRHGVAAVRAKLERGRLAQACKPGRHYLKGIKKSLLQSLSKEVRGRPMLTFLRKQWNRNGGASGIRASTEIRNMEASRPGAVAVVVDDAVS
ncbi:uncharacterized protein LOC124671976 isoform X2 [Lolium rigidum]|uniref:uncharacterized protein LOC124671976 isoform X2 n=1 Tax=Lolium rigidum TaxID=89674 RepID=UPI001F5D8AAB|nr:uncharacterized protein LOC124671976 isoform X2 [Lolium rigidum]